MFYSFDYMFFTYLFKCFFLSDHIIIFNALLLSLLEGELKILSKSHSVLCLFFGVSLSSVSREIKVFL
jgi:hypothetical protein